MKNKIFKMLQIFADLTTDVPSPLNTTGTATMSIGMKTFYDTQLLQNARALLYFNQFGKKQTLPKNAGRTIEFRKPKTYKNVKTPLTEGVTPEGNTFGMTKLEVTIQQYGDYTAVSDRLQFEHIDPIISMITEEHGAQAGESMDCLTRDVLAAGTNVLYAGGKTSRSALTSADTLTPTLINRAYTILKKGRAPLINGKYIAIVDPSTAYDLRENPNWIDVHKYSATTQIFNGEIGELHNIRFIETDQTKKWRGTADGCAANTTVYGLEFFGKDAYAVIEPTAESMEVIVKGLGSAGTADPLNQRSTIGWKGSTAAIILYPERLLRVEVGSFFSATDEAN